MRGEARTGCRCCRRRRRSRYSAGSGRRWRLRRGGARFFSTSENITLVSEVAGCNVWMGFLASENDKRQCYQDDK